MSKYGWVAAAGVVALAGLAGFGVQRYLGSRSAASVEFDTSEGQPAAESPAGLALADEHPDYRFAPESDQILERALQAIHFAEGGVGGAERAGEGVDCPAD